MKSPIIQTPSPKRNETKLGLERIITKINPKNPALILWRSMVFINVELDIFF